MVSRCVRSARAWPARTAARTIRASRSRRSAALSQPDRACRRLRQERGRARPACRASVSASWRSAPSRRMPQAGNPRPRIFRLDEDRAVINRLGFNNDGPRRLPSRGSPRAAQAGDCRSARISGSTRTARCPSATTRRCVRGACAPHADYIVVNVSSPNTPGLRDLQGEARLRSILAAIAARGAAPSAAAGQARARSAAGGARGRRGDLRRRRRGRADRLEHHDLAAARPALAATRPRRAGCPARRCARCPPRMLARAARLAARPARADRRGRRRHRRGRAGEAPRGRQPGAALHCVRLCADRRCVPRLKRELLAALDARRLRRRARRPSARRSEEFACST